ncbi:5-azacytidine resistance protein azr1 [Phlyctema vagabunda]|uniref:Protein phosphatase n=1 Tax=Phlyctema vagabunda TaxID=108571 RepID=A0ABR4P5U1_9HELO
MEPPLRRVAITACRHNSLCSQISRPAALPVFRSSPRYHSSIASSSVQKSVPSLPKPAARSFHTSRVVQSNSDPKFTYGIAASFNAKDTRYNPNTHVFNFNPYNAIRARRKDKRTRPASGQDAFFVSKIGESPDVAFGVADGVGGWIDSGVDPADFAHGLCDYMAYAAYTHTPDATASPATTPLSARSLMQKGYDDIVKDETVRAGGSTACVALALEDGSMEIANLGDSGFVQLRLNAIHNLSDPQTHAFNTPYQLSKMEQEEQEQSDKFGTSQIRDYPKDASVTKHSLRHGDVIIFASDGVWDNLSASEILRVVSRLMVGARAWVHTEDGIKIGSGLRNFVLDGDSKEDLPRTLQSFLAAGITGEAKAASMNTKRNGPFAKEVQKYYPGEHWRGGKVDDICVVVAIAVEEGK